MRRNARECDGMGGAVPCSTMRRHAVPSATSDAGLGSPMLSHVLPCRPTPPHAVACSSILSNAPRAVHSCPVLPPPCFHAALRRSLPFPLPFPSLAGFGGSGENRQRETCDRGRGREDCKNLAGLRLCGSVDARECEGMRWNGKRSPIQLGGSPKLPSAVTCSSMLSDADPRCRGGCAAAAQNFMLSNAPRAVHSCPVPPPMFCAALRRSLPFPLPLPSLPSPSLPFPCWIRRFGGGSSAGISIAALGAGIARIWQG
jgi:hypothetical protein